MQLIKRGITSDDKADHNKAFTALLIRIQISIIAFLSIISHSALFAAHLNVIVRKQHANERKLLHINNDFNICEIYNAIFII
jgi:hypothetical protein